MLKIRRPLGRLIFNMGIAIPGKTVFLIETAPSIMPSPLSISPSRIHIVRINTMLFKNIAAWIVEKIAVDEKDEFSHSYFLWIHKWQVPYCTFVLMELGKNILLISMYRYPYFTCITVWALIQYKMSYQYRKSHCGDKTVARSCYLFNWISYTGKMSSLYWIGTLVFIPTFESFSPTIFMADRGLIYIYIYTYIFIIIYMYVCIGKWCIW